MISVERAAPGGRDTTDRHPSDEEEATDLAALPAGSDDGLSLGMPDGFMCEGTVATDGNNNGGKSGGENDRNSGGMVTRLQLPAWATSVAPSLNGHPGANVARLVLSSAVEPEHHVDFRCERLIPLSDGCQMLCQTAVRRGIKWPDDCQTGL